MSLGLANKETGMSHTFFVFSLSVFYFNSDVSDVMYYFSDTSGVLAIYY